MEKTNTESSSGLFLRGIVVSNSARILTRKDGTGRSVLVTHEIALQPGVAKWVEFIEEHDPRVKVKGDSVEDFPILKEFAPIQLKVNSLRADKGQIEIKSAEILS